MGLGGLSLGHILVVLLVVILVFGTKKLGSIGSDLGEAIKGFRKAMSNQDDPQPGADNSTSPPPAHSADSTSRTSDTQRS
jgi:sec-independent protein translocase protein TatA